jgi:Na+:H+ antiporter, NhaA family
VSEAGGGIVLMIAAAAALVAANSPIAPAYFRVLQIHVAGLNVLHWINDGLMTVFFLLIGLEIKREMLEGQLSSWSHRVLPGIAAAGGMVVPAIIYLAFNASSPETWRGWAIPSATDIAFSLGVLAFLGKRVPVSLKIFLTAVAIVDDLGAVAILAAFYTAELSFPYLAGSLFVVGILCAFNFVGLKKLSAYLIVGSLLWFLVLKSGVHATLAGVAVAFTIPLPSKKQGKDDHKLLILEHALQQWVAYLIVPIFGFANAGVSFAGMNSSVLLAPVTLGVATGLFFGKQCGVLLASWIAVRLEFAKRPNGASWTQLYGVAVLCGIGFTMSLFIGSLAFPDDDLLMKEVKLGVLAGSLLAGAVGVAVLALAPKHRSEKAI